MHETSLIATVLRQSLSIASASDDSEIVEIHLSIGPLAGVEPALLATAFERLAPEFGLRGATLRVQERELTAVCRACQLEYRVADFEFTCPTCGSTDADVVSGDAVMIESLTLRSRSDAVSTSINS
jgi:hydrogenase nickel incorporation protein HypA/HybF